MQQISEIAFHDNRFALCASRKIDALRTIILAELAEKRRANRGSLPENLLRIEQIIEPENTICPCCGKQMHVIGEDKSERLDKAPVGFLLTVTRRPEYGCEGD